MTAIRRDPSSKCGHEYDLIVVGGGVYGCCLTLEAARRGLSVLLLERDDFGSGTSWNSLRIIHGGLRYLQQGDLRRFCRSVREQAWWLQYFPELVQPLSCLMPLYNRGLRRTDVMRLALACNHRMAQRVRRSMGFQGQPIQKGQVISAQQTCARFPAVDRQGLRGGAVWSDAHMPHPQRLLMEILRWASLAGAEALNYLAVQDLWESRGRVRGVDAVCQISQRTYRFRARHVVGCAGPWTQELLKDRRLPRSDCGLAWAFNVLVNRAPLSRDAVAITPPLSQAPTYFMLPCQGRTLIGTVHLPEKGLGQPTSSQLDGLLAELNRTVPGYGVTSADIVGILAGRMPASKPGSHVPGRTPRISHHRTLGGPEGLTTVLGVKFTTARDVAERTLRGICDLYGLPIPDYRSVHRPPLRVGASLCLEQDGLVDLPAHDLQKWMDDESVVHIDDFLLRRCNFFGMSPERRFSLAEHVMRAAGWDPDRRQAELARLDSHTGALPELNAC